jgi:hypothetical protein
MRSRRRLSALLALLSLGVFTFEPVIADVCDADGREAVWSTPESQPSSPAPGAPGERDGHAAHVCHCAHGHVVAVSAPVALGVVAGDAVAALPMTLNALLDPPQQPRVRPPIA